MEVRTIVRLGQTCIWCDINGSYSQSLTNTSLVTWGSHSTKNPSPISYLSLPGFRNLFIFLNIRFYREWGILHYNVRNIQILRKFNFLGFIVIKKTWLLFATNSFLIRFVVMQLTLHYNQNFAAQFLLKCCSLGQERCLVSVNGQNSFSEEIFTHKAKSLHQSSLHCHNFQFIYWG